MTRYGTHTCRRSLRATSSGTSLQMSRMVEMAEIFDVSFLSQTSMSISIGVCNVVMQPSALLAEKDRRVCDHLAFESASDAAPRSNTSSLSLMHMLCETPICKLVCTRHSIPSTISHRHMPRSSVQNPGPKRVSAGSLTLTLTLSSKPRLRETTSGMPSFN
jgi:hypothetical protein